MLNKLDDYPVHQTPEPLAQPATSDRNVYDRTWYNGYANDGSYYFGLGMAVYPHRQVQDAAFSVVRAGGLQHCFFGSRRAPDERTDMSVGPLRLEIIEPMRRTRVVLDDNDSPIACDLTYSARSAAIQEGRQTLWNGARRIMDATRFDQFGVWEGTIHTPEGDIAVDPAECRATKDRSWGMRGVGEAETGGAPGQPGGFFFLWAPLFWEDHISHAIFFDGQRGEALHREGLVAPLYAAEADIPGVEDGLVDRLATALHRVEYHPATRLARYAEIDLIALDGAKRTVCLEPILRFQFKGLGYGHKKWRQGTWQGELVTGHESFDPAELDLLRPENIHVQQVVRAFDGSRNGIGTLEQIVVGPYEPAGFTDWLEGAP
ncbi:MAG: hypothetical protein QF921_09240 [Pseudomonadales bacterium]|nr:hypothetical protein [Pseudomonadales bacterium]MDP6472568.1 hypothetical protein [Pseudomonadales bacterium]MDP6829050.1 hypothetical protein [Pseudomonadales bacterium]MDP6971677.1 hypothetical protein [Pseudomonadales bacterium]